MPTGCSATCPSITSPRTTRNARAISELAPAMPHESIVQRFDAPTTILSGGGCRRQLADLVREFGGTRVLVVTDPGVVQLGVAGEIVDSLAQAGLSVAVFDQ